MRGVSSPPRSRDLHPTLQAEPEVQPLRPRPQIGESVCCWRPCSVPPCVSETGRAGSRACPFTQVTPIHNQSANGTLINELDDRDSVFMEH